MKIDLQIPLGEEIGEGERRQYATAINVAFNTLEKDIKAEMYEQLVETYCRAVGVTRSKEERDFEIIRGNGIMEGMAILLEKWRLVTKEHESYLKGEDKGDPQNPMPEL